MRRPISPAEWDALTPRYQRRAGERPTDQSYAEAMVAYEAWKAETAALAERLAPMLAVGGREWTGENGQRRIYFDIFRIPNYDHRRGVVEGYYNVTNDRFVANRGGRVSDDEWADYIRGVIARGCDLPLDVAVTLDSMGNEIHEGDECMLTTPRDDSRIYQDTPELDVRINAGRIVIAQSRVRNWPGLHTHWHIFPADPTYPFIVSGKSFDCQHSWLIVRSSYLTLINPRGRMPAPRPIPAHPLETT